MARFHDRRDAGRFLARKLLAFYADRPDVIVLALPRGGVPVGYEVARALHAPLDVFLGERAPPEVRGRTVVLVDDGLATGAAMPAAVQALRRLGSARIVVAVPAAPPEACDELRKRADEVICAIAPEFLRAVGYWYEDFSQTSDEDVRRFLHYAWADQVERLHADRH
jgi:predicted phosphoribosyltransferase